MTSPGGREVGRVSIRVVPDVSGLRRTLQREIDGIEAGLRIQVGIDLDRSDLERQLREIEVGLRRLRVGIDLDTTDVERRLDEIARDRRSTITVDVDRGAASRIASVASSVGGLAGSLLKVAAISTAVGSAIPAIGGLAAGLAQAAGAIALLPAVGLAAAAGVGALAVGLNGVGEALKTATSPAQLKAQAAALKSLAPAAREAVQALGSLRPALKDLQQSVQQSLFDGLAGPLKALGTDVLPLVRTGFGNIASEANLAAKSAIEFLRLPQSLTDTAAGLGNTSAAFAALRGSVTPILSIFRDLAAVGGTFLPSLAQGFTTAATGAADFIKSARESGKLGEFIQTSLVAVKDLSASLVNVGKVLVNVFTAGQTGGGGFLANLRTITQAIVDFTSRPDVQAGLSAFFAGSAQAVAIVAQAFQTLGPVIAAIGPLFGTLAVQVAGVLSAVVAAVGPVVTALAPAFTGLLAVLGPVIEQLVNALAPALATLAANLGPIVLIVGGALAQAFGTLAPVLGQIAVVLGGLILTALNALLPVLPIFVSALAQIAPVLGQVAVTLGTVLTTALVSIAPLLPVIVQAFSDLVVALLPVVPAVLQLVSALLPLIPPIVQIITTLLPPFIALVVALLPPIIAVASYMAGQFVGAVVSATQVLLTIVQAVATVIAAVVRFVADLVTNFGSIPGKVSSALSGLGGTLSRIASSALSDFGGAILNGIGTALSFFADLPGRIESFVGNINLFSAGARIVGSLVDGIRSRIGAVIGAMGDLAAAAGRLIPGSPVRQGALRVLNNGRAGGLIATMLADGIAGRQSAVTDAMRGLTTSAATVLVPRPNSVGGAPAGVAGGGLTTIYNGDFYSYDPTQIERARLSAQRDAAAVAGLVGIA